MRNEGSVGYTTHLISENILKLLTICHLCRVILRVAVTNTVTNGHAAALSETSRCPNIVCGSRTKTDADLFNKLNDSGNVM